MNIRFADEETHKAFCESLAFDDAVPEGGRTLAQCILGLMRWRDDSTATIALDPWPRKDGLHDFTFCEVYPDGKRGIFGGIVCHYNYKDGEPDGTHEYATHT